MEAQYQWTELSEAELLPEIEIPAVQRMLESVRKILVVRRQSDAFTHTFMETNSTHSRNAMPKLLEKFTKRFSASDNFYEQADVSPWYSERPACFDLVPDVCTPVIDIDLSQVLTQ